MRQSSLAATRMVLVQRRDTVAPRNPTEAKIRRYRLARVQLNGAYEPRVPRERS